MLSVPVLGHGFRLLDIEACDNNIWNRHEALQHVPFQSKWPSNIILFIFVLVYYYFYKHFQTLEIDTAIQNIHLKSSLPFARSWNLTLMFSVCCDEQLGFSLSSAQHLTIACNATYKKASYLFASKLISSSHSNGVEIGIVCNSLICLKYLVWSAE